LKGKKVALIGLALFICPTLAYFTSVLIFSSYLSSIIVIVCMFTTLGGLIAMIAGGIKHAHTKRVTRKATGYTPI
jgi:uncharacterized integral membrane protein